MEAQQVCDYWYSLLIILVNMMSRDQIKVGDILC